MIVGVKPNSRHASVTLALSDQQILKLVKQLTSAHIQVVRNTLLGKRELR
jgi:hypothetical protein